MPYRWRIALTAVFCFLIAAGAGGYFVLASRVSRGDFKLLAENRVGDFFKTRVRIGNIRPHLFNQISLTELVVGSEKSSEKHPYFVHIEKVVFRYNFLQLLIQNFKTPNVIVLEAPKVILDQTSFPYDLFQRLGLDAKSGGMGSSTLKIKGGEVRIPVGLFHTELRLNDIQGSLQSEGDGKISVSFKAHASGLLKGDLLLAGVIDVFNKTHHLDLKMEGISFSDVVALPFDRLDGNVRLENGKFIFDNLEGTIKGWKNHLSGALWNLGPAPAFELDWQVGKKDFLGAIHFEGDLAAENFKASLQPFLKQEIILEGKIRREGMNFFSDAYKTNTGYEGSGKLDFESGAYDFSFRKENQIIAVESNLKGLSFHLRLDLNHVKFWNLDVATKMEIELDPVALRWEEHDWKFRGSFNTDYFILEYIPWQDFSGSFEIVPYAVKNFTSFWGDVFQMDAELNFQPAIPDGKADLRVHGFDLSHVKEFASKPLPKDLGGKLEGKLHIEGPIFRPEVVGNFNVHDGKIGKLLYDRGIIQFRGFPPYLALYDSRILKGRTTLYLTGALNLALPNMFHGIRIETSDKIVIWKGIQAHTSQGGLEIEHVWENLPEFALESVGQKKKSIMDEPSQNAEDNPGVVVGPKVKF
ncbi:MAG: hypothetical protein HYZ84_06080 [Candidatus Omnitrophica bacterium]|nr:hypothetical protein [Candidatus Omnitrophota bacterium]